MSALQKHNFPVNYSIRVYRQEIFKLSNISRMVRNSNTQPGSVWTWFCGGWCVQGSSLTILFFFLKRVKVEGLDELVLQRLWFQINQGILKKVNVTCQMDPPGSVHVFITLIDSEDAADSNVATP